MSSCNTEQKRILNTLLDAYENSLSFQGKNRKHQTFSIRPEKLFPSYGDDAEYLKFASLNESMENLLQAGFVTLQKETNGIIKRVILRQDAIEDCYQILGRRSRKAMQAGLLEVLAAYAGEANADGATYAGPDDAMHHEGATADPDDAMYGESAAADPLEEYVRAQRERIARNKNVEYYEETDTDFSEFSDLLCLVRAILDHEQEVFIRDFSIQLFGDSKRVEQLRAKAQGLLFQYGSFDDRETVLAECGVLSTPTYVSVKGQLRLSLGGQVLDLSGLHGDISLSTETLSDVEDITVSGKRVITIENLTTFHDFPGDSDAVIYLGGFHNAVKRKFLKRLHQQNPDCNYYHFGDLDAGGFYILSHLRRKTGISFTPLYMDTETLKEYQEYAKPLTQNDRKRLRQLLEHSEYREEAGDVLRYMLEHDCKLEQEAIHINR